MRLRKQQHIFSLISTAPSFYFFFFRFAHIFIYWIYTKCGCARKIVFASTFSLEYVNILENCAAIRVHFVLLLVCAICMFLSFSVYIVYRRFLRKDIKQIPHHITYSKFSFTGNMCFNEYSRSQFYTCMSAYFIVLQHLYVTSPPINELNCTYYCELHSLK